MVIRCPYCGKELIDFSISMVNKGVYQFWCDDCNMEVYITKKNVMIDTGSIITVKGQEVNYDLA